MLSYPDAQDDESGQKIYSGSKKHIYPILYFILQNFEELKQRAYLGYYLVPLTIPDEFLMNEEIKQLQE